jgi:eukaryotic-like serine/threonine-protein kinase
MSADSSGRSDSPLRIGPYIIIKRVGAGGMGAVYRARDSELGREVALKVLPPELAERPEMLARFHEEARHAAKLRHEHIVTLYGFNSFGGTYILAMEFVEGKNLHEYIDEKERLDPEEARRLIIQAARALALAHQQGIVHRDIKPSNFLLTKKEGRPFVKLTDFGLARSIDDNEFKMTRSGTTVGTVDYIAPEQARNSRAADIRSDIYSLGCTLYHMLAGRPPFPEGDMTERLLKHIEAQAEDVRTFNPKVPPGLVVVLNKMMAKKPDQRYQTPKELLKDLEHLPSGPILSPREILEALALDESHKLKPQRRAGAEKPKTLHAEPARLAGPSFIRRKLTKLRYRRLRLLAKKHKDLESDRRGSVLPFAIHGWKAWTAVGGGTALAVLAAIAIALGWGTGEPQSSRHSEPVKEESYVESLEKATRVDSGKRQLSSLDPPKKVESPVANKGVNPPTQVQIVRPKSFAPPVYQPPPDQLAQLEKQFPARGGPPSQMPVGHQAGQPPSSPTSVGSKGSGTSPQPSPGSAPKTGEQPTPAANRPPAAVYVVSRLPVGTEGRHFDSLKAACAAAPADRDTTIEIHDNGPIFAQPAAVSGRRLTIRAGAGYRPLLAWDTTSSANQFIMVSKGSLNLEGVDLVFKHSDSSQDEAACLIRADNADLVADKCTFSVAGKHRAGTAMIRLDGSGACKCDLSHCYFRGADATVVDVRAAGAEVMLDGCLLVCAARPALEVLGKVGATATKIRVARSTLVAGQTLLRVRPASTADRSAALHWNSLDSLFAHSNNQTGGELVDLQDGATTSGMQWSGVNCLYFGWATLLRCDAGNISQSQLDLWHKLWGQGDWDKVDAETWPAVVPPDPAEMPAAGFRVVGTHAAYAATTGSGALGCDVSKLPPGRDGWLAVTYERFVPAAADITALDPPPSIPDAGDGRYHGEQLDLNNVNLGDHLREVQQKQQLGPRVVLRLRGKGEVRTGPVLIKGSTLVLYFEQPEEDADRVVLLPRNAADREALIGVEGGSLEILGGSIRFPNSANLPVPRYLLKVHGGHLRLTGCRLQGPLDQTPNAFRALVSFAGAGQAADQPFECVAADSLLVSGRDGFEVAGGSAHVRLQNCAAVVGGDAIRVKPEADAPGYPDSQYVLEHNSIAARQAVFHLDDVANAPAALEPLLVQARSNVFFDPFTGPRRGGLTRFDGAALAHGLAVWQGEGNVYDKQFSFFIAASPEQAPGPAQPYAPWSRTWGPFAERRALHLEPSARTLDLANLRLERLALPETFRARHRGALPGADLEQLGILQSKKK